MTQLELLNRILYLVPNAQVCIKHSSAAIDEAASEELIIEDLKIVWNSQNKESCPSISQILKTPQSDIDTATEIRKKQERDDSLQNDVHVKIGLNIAQASDPNITLTKYLDDLGI